RRWRSVGLKARVRALILKRRAYSQDVHDKGTWSAAFSAKKAIGFAVQSAQIRPREQGLLPSRCVAADEADALGDVGDGIFPLVFVFDGDVAFEVLALQFIQNCRNVRHAGAVWQVVRLDLAELVQVFQVTADDPAF